MNKSNKQPNLKFKLTNRLHKQLIVNHYLFQHNNTVNNVVNWRCKESRNHIKCKSTCTTNGETESSLIINNPSTHNHEPYNDDQLLMLDFKSNLKNRSKVDKTPIPIYFYFYLC